VRTVNAKAVMKASIFEFMGYSFLILSVNGWTLILLDYVSIDSSRKRIVTSSFLVRFKLHYRITGFWVNEGETPPRVGNPST
jgi:hypothetical protein